jgi:NAD+ diphosphatase
MREEAGIVVAEPKYLGSQAWPFPYSLMLGYMAKYVGGDVVPDGEEIVKLRWFTRDELKAEGSELLLPGKLSIARAIIEHWLGEELQTGE